MHYIALDAHKRYTLASVEPAEGGGPKEYRIEHKRGAVVEFLRQFDPGSPVAVETIGNYYWIADEIEEAGMEPKLVHALKAKLQMGQINKTDKLDARGMNRLQRTGTLPTVWIPPGEVRDQRELARTRMALTAEGVSDVFSVKGRKVMASRLPQLPPESRYSTERLLELLDLVQGQIRGFEKRLEEVVGASGELDLVRTLPCIGLVLGTVVVTEVGDVRRFAQASRLAAYAGTTPRVHASGGRTRIGRLRPDVNRYLKWAYVEAANSIAMNRRHWPERHAVRLYERVRAKKGHQKAVGAVARHLAEATYWVLSKREAYREPPRVKVSSTEG